MSTLSFTLTSAFSITSSVLVPVGVPIRKGTTSFFGITLMLAMSETGDFALSISLKISVSPMPRSGSSVRYLISLFATFCSSDAMIGPTATSASSLYATRKFLFTTAYLQSFSSFGSEALPAFARAEMISSISSSSVTFAHAPRLPSGAAKRYTGAEISTPDFSDDVKASSPIKSSRLAFALSSEATRTIALL